MCVPVVDGGGRAGWFGWPALCELFVRRESQSGEEGEPGVRLSCWLVRLLLVTLFDEIRRDQLSDHASCSLSAAQQLFLGNTEVELKLEWG